MDWQVSLALAAICISAFTLIGRMLDKGLSVREHDEYRKGAGRVTDGLREQFQREIDKIEHRIDVIEQTRPTAGELKGTADGLRDQVNEIKIQMRQRNGTTE